MKFQCVVSPRRVGWLLGIACSICLMMVQPSSAAEKSDIDLGKPPASFGVDLADALKMRKSTKEYTPEVIPSAQLGEILWAANGMNRDDGKRTAPTPRGLYFINIFVLGKDGIFLYVPEKAQLTKVSEKNILDKAGTQPYMASCSQMLALVANFKAYSTDIPQEEKIRTAAITAGCIAQNVYLACAALKRSTCLVVSMNEAALRQALSLGVDDLPLLIMPLGIPR